MTRTWRSIAGWSGVVFVVLFVTSSLGVADAPVPGAADAEVRQWVADNKAAIAWTTWGGGVSLGLLLLLFASGLHRVFRNVDDDGAEMWSRMSLTGAVLMAATGLSKAAFWVVLSLEDVRAALSDGALVALAALDSVAVAALVPWGAAAFLLGASVAILTTGVMGRWVGWLGIVSSALFVVGTLWLFGGDVESPLAILTLLGYLGLLVWSLAAAISMIRPSPHAVHRTAMASPPTVSPSP